MPASSTHHPHTAKIFQFPIGGRATVGPRGRTGKVLTLQTQKMQTVAAHDSWYHEAAIEEARRSADTH